MTEAEEDAAVSSPTCSPDAAKRQNFVSVRMEDSSEPSHWGSPSLLASDPLAGFPSEPSLLPPGDDGDSFFSSQDADLAGLPSFFSSPANSRAPPSYRHSSGQ